MSGERAEIKAKIQEYQQVISNLDEQRKQLDEQVKKLESRLNALNLTLEILQETPGSPRVLRDKKLKIVKSLARPRALGKNSSAGLALKILKEEKTGLHNKILYERVLLKNPKIKKDSFMSSLYRFAGEGRYFCAKDGVFGLVEEEGKEIAQLPVRSE